MRYEGTVYRPPSEANSLLIQSTIGCPHNKCTFCDMYKGTRFRLRPLDDILEDIKMARDHYGPWINSMFLPDGNTIIMKTDALVQIFEFARAMFPQMERITVYGSARFVDKKSLEDLKRLKDAGLNRIHMGMESGDDVTLARVSKGTTAEQIIRAGQKVREAGIQLSEYFLVGIGGLDRTTEHARESARVLSAIAPEFIRIRTFVPIPNTPIYKDYTDGSFQVLSPHQALAEIRLLVENLDAPGSWVVSDHVSNYWNVHGQLPQDKEEMLAQIDHALTIPEHHFRSTDISNL
ncbi:MAG: radical SAM protein [Syntrophomonadaceae bacterium]|nr:radical SAM protein [Syntrophomonadaceae bacterium]